MAVNSYVIHQSNGQELVTLSEGATNSTSSSLTLIGKKVAYYGEILNENLVHLLENFARPESPVHPLPGQLWYNSTSKVLHVYNGDRWKQANGTVVSEAAPLTSDAVGDLWWNTSTEQLFVWSGSEWSLIGPASTNVGGTTGVVADTLIDVDGGQHLVLMVYVAGEPVAVINREPSPPTFVTRSIDGQPFTVKPGFTAYTSSLMFNGVAEDALNLGGVSAATYIRDDQPVSLTYALTAPTVAAGGILVDSVTNTLSVPTGQNFSINYGRGGLGVGTAAISIDTAGNVTVAASPTLPLGIATKQYVDSNASGTLTNNTWVGEQTFRTGAFRVVSTTTPSKEFRIGVDAIPVSSTITMEMPAGVTSFTPAISARAANTGITIGNRKRVGRHSQTDNNPGALQELFPDLGIGALAFYLGKTAPDANWLPLNGAAINRVTYADLFAHMVKSHQGVGIAVVTVANPCVVSWPLHGLSANDPIRFTTAGGTLPASIAASPGVTTFYVKTVLNVNAFTISATAGGAEINTDGQTSSGNIIVWYAPFGLGDLSTTFNLPNYPAGHFGLQYQNLTPFVKALAN